MWEDNNEDLECEIASCKCGNESCKCSKHAIQYADVGVPVKLKPLAMVGQIKIECCDEPVICCCPKQSCDNGYNCDNGCNCDNCCNCEITITQTVSIKIPIEYSVKAEVGETIFNCKDHIKCDCDDIYKYEK